MRKTPKIILSASRRTDIPAFYMDDFMQGLDEGAFEVVNPYNQRRRRIPARVHDIHSIVFWSKNFGPFLNGNFDRRLTRRGYRLFFNFTINGPSPELEPHIPALDERLRQAAALCRRYGPDAVTWRFDPVCFFRRDGQSVLENNLDALAPIAEALAALGIKRCVTSFVDLYPKVRRRLPAAGLQLVDPPLAVKCDTLTRMASLLASRQIRLRACCEKSVLKALSPDVGVRPGDCIPGPLLAACHGADMALRKDPGQRRSQGCTCNLSADIGSYRDHPCYHDCLFCYANPHPPPPDRRYGDSGSKGTPRPCASVVSR